MPQLSSTQEALSTRILRLTNTEQAAFTKAYLDDGMPGEQASVLDVLVLNRSSLVLPLVESKIEQVLKARNPAECFTNKNVDPVKFVAFAASAIHYAGDQQALEETGKLLRVDEKRFDGLIGAVLSAAINRQGNPFALAYRGLEMGDPGVSRRIAAWAEDLFKRPAAITPWGIGNRWAEALVDRYGAVPTETEWSNDPIVSRLKPELAEALRKDVFRLAFAAWEKHPRRMLAMSDAEQIAFTKSQLDSGLPPEGLVALGVLARSHSSLILPIVVTRIEEVLKSAKPTERFADSTVDPRLFLAGATSVIAEAGDEEALKQTAKLLRLGRFDGLVTAILRTADDRGNPFKLAYKGIDIGDPAVSKKIVAWAEEMLVQPALNLPKDMRHQWAEAMVDRYGSAPVGTQWTIDPIASGLKRVAPESLYDEVFRFAADAAERRSRK